MAGLETISMETSRPILIKLFKQLDEQKKVNKTRAALMEKIKSIVPYLGIPKGFERFILELYVLNYRDDGDYSQLTKDNYVDPRKGTGKTTSNTQADLYTRAQLPFKGSNLRGFWERDGVGGTQYVVESYGWYPIFIFKDGSWFQITDSYSSSTGRQISNANPVEWSDDLHQYVTLLTRDEMKDLRRGKKVEDIKKDKLKRLKRKEEELVKKRMSSVSTWADWENPGKPRTKIKYKISKIDVDGDKAIITVDIYDVLKNVNNVGVSTPENYLKGELPGITKEFIEKSVTNNLLRNFREYVGPRFGYYDGLSDIHNIKFKFNHLKGNQ